MKKKREKRLPLHHHVRVSYPVITSARTDLTVTHVCSLYHKGTPHLFFLTLSTKHQYGGCAKFKYFNLNPKSSRTFIISEILRVFGTVFVFKTEKYFPRLIRITLRAY